MTKPSTNPSTIDVIEHLRKMSRSADNIWGPGHPARHQENLRVTPAQVDVLLAYFDDVNKRCEDLQKRLGRMTLIVHVSLMAMDIPLTGDLTNDDPTVRLCEMANQHGRKQGREEAAKELAALRAEVAALKGST